MDAPTLVFALFLALVGFLIANSRLLLLRDSVRGEDVVFVVTTSLLLTVVLGSFLLRSLADPGSILLWAHFVAAMVAVLVTDAASRLRASQRLRTEEFVDARR